MKTHFSVVVIAALFASPTFADFLDARKACDLLKDANDQKIAKLENRTPNPNVRIRTDEILKAMLGNVETVGIKDSYLNAFKEATESEDLTEEQKKEILNALDATVSEKLMSLRHGDFWKFDSNWIHIDYLDDSFSAKAGQVRRVFKFTAKMFQYQGEHRTYTIAFDLIAGSFEIELPESPEIRRLKTLVELPEYCRKYYPHS